jgi:Na+-transporting methylmalonyl-CoA/oxaloacetate decarboxylase gamma subunit
MDETGVFITILLIVLGIGIVFAVLAVILVNNSSNWWNKL